ncbi:MAG: cytidylate kinase-like family protein [Clostridia bacterium]|jgi:cytidylate kinase|nr:cytidylate kinase-like family protein [Clostridia bacterium]MCI1959474.1 cytidylate kinase-like family protein [Clostridia bacterium]MCI2000966.1 cytidylate kinase-like family protein [Clostridia bacterium]MCI2015750.1 cytidylate kinase-like family protein [Clostridia bacterium]
MSKVIVTIGRQYGSGGRRIGELVAKELGISFYDKELITETAKKSGYSEEVLKNNDEKPTGSFLYSIVIGANGGDSLPLDNKLFLAQFDTIKDIASKNSCVIIGRCADYALEERNDVFNVFIYSDVEKRIKRVVEEYGVEEKKAADIINKTDKKRASYYNFYSGKKWGKAESYNLCIDSGKFGIENTAKIIADCAINFEKSEKK